MFPSQLRNISCIIFQVVPCRLECLHHKIYIWFRSLPFLYSIYIKSRKIREEHLGRPVQLLSGLAAISSTIINPNVFMKSEPRTIQMLLIRQSTTNREPPHLSKVLDDLAGIRLCDHRTCLAPRPLAVAATACYCYFLYCCSSADVALPVRNHGDVTKIRRHPKQHPCPHALWVCLHRRPYPHTHLLGCYNAFYLRCILRRRGSANPSAAASMCERGQERGGWRGTEP
jgi:hypothetical protein